MVRDKETLELMAKKANLLSKRGSYVAELVNDNPYETVTAEIFNVEKLLGGTYTASMDRGLIYNTASGQIAPLPSNSTTCAYKDVLNNILYIGTTDAGVWEYNFTTRVGKVYNTTSGADFGSQIPSIDSFSIYKDSTNNILYVATGAGVWEYNVSTRTGKIYNTIGGAGFGQQIRADSVSGVYKDEVNNVLYASCSGLTGCVWEYNVNTDTGKQYTNAGGAGSGLQLPNDWVFCVFKDYQNDILYAGTLGGGVWRYDVGTDTGSVYNTAGGVSAGLQLPDNNVVSIYKDIVNNMFYAATSAGLWELDVAMDFGKIYNTLGGAGNGSQVPADAILFVFKDEVDGFLYAGSGLGLWEYNTTTDTGKTYNTSSGAAHGSQLPSNQINAFYKDAQRNILYTCVYGFGIWQYAYISNIRYTGSTVRTVTYSQFVTDIITQPIIITEIKLMCTNPAQFDKPITLYYSTPYGAVRSFYYSSLASRFATDGDNTVLDIHLDKPIVFSKDNYFKMDILPANTIYFTVYYKQMSREGLMKEMVTFVENGFEEEK